MDGSFAAPDSNGSQLWRAIPTFFQYESLSIFSRRPFRPVEAIYKPFKKAAMNSLLSPKAIVEEFRAAKYSLYRDIKDGYGHHSMGRRANGRVFPIYDDINIAGFLPDVIQRRKDANGTLGFCNVRSEKEIWDELFWYGKKFNGALSDDDDITPRPALVWNFTKEQFERHPEEVKKQAANRKYHAKSKRSVNCWTFHLDVMRGLGVHVPKALEAYRLPVDITRDIRNRKLVRALAEFSSSVVIVTREQMAAAIAQYIESRRPETIPSNSLRFAANAG